MDYLVRYDGNELDNWLCHVNFFSVLLLGLYSNYSTCIILFKGSALSQLYDSFI